MGNFMRVGPDLDGALAEGERETLTDEQVIEGQQLPENPGASRISFDSDGNPVESHVHNKVERVQMHESPSSIYQTRINGLQQQFDELVEEREDLSPSDYRYKTLTAKMEALDKQAVEIRQQEQQAAEADAREAGRIAGRAEAEAIEEIEENQRFLNDLEAKRRARRFHR